MINRIQEKINIRNNSSLDIAYVAQSQGLTITEFVRLAIHEYCDRHGISKTMPSSNQAA